MTLSKIRNKEKGNRCLGFTSSITREVKKFHVVVVQVWTDDNGERHDVIHHIPLVLRMRCKGCYRISIVLAFSCERTKTIRIRYV